jgi:uncharacterized membrane protein YedE/YeeE
MLENFTPLSGIIGGLLIGTAAALMLWANGRITGISGILGGILFPARHDMLWRVLFVAGLLLGPILFVGATGAPVGIVTQAPPLLTVFAGLLVGFGTRLGSGCTSGHGICGIARFSRRSFAATSIFMGSAIVTVFITQHVLGVP